MFECLVLTNEQKGHKKGTKFHQHIFESLWVKYQRNILRATVFQNGIKMHWQESDTMGTHCNTISLSLHDLIKDEKRFICC